MTFNELLELDRETRRKQTESSPRGAGISSEAAPRPAPVKKEAKVARRRDAARPRDHGIMTPSMVARLRKAVKQVGKEAATHRFTQTEKESLRDVVYTYGRQGYRTSENEIARIGVNWLVEDYRENGKRSVLHRILKALKE